MSNNGSREPRTNKTVQKAFNYIRIHHAELTAAVLTLSAVLFISFIDTATRETVLSYSIKEFEIGQIADRTVTAEKDIEQTGEAGISMRKGDKIIKKGFPISSEDYLKLRILAETPSYIDYRAFSNAVLYFLLLLVLSFFLFSSDMIGRHLAFRELAFLAVSFIIVYGSAALGKKLPAFSSPFTLPVIIPAALAVMLSAVLCGEKSAVFFTVLASLAVLYAHSFHPVPALYVLCLGCLSARVMRKIQKRIDMVFVSLLIALFSLTAMILLRFIFSSDAGHDSLYGFIGAAVTGFISGILALGFLTPLESLLNTSSVFRLMDLSDLNSPLMKRMLVAAPGTYNHSMMVATLAENACSEIGANPLLARVGAYYHDLGKMENPEYFIENQRGGNKHDEINPRLSVSIIRRHVKKGVEKAHQMRFPQEVISIISEHHGNSVISYFYNEAKKSDPDVSPEEFSYIGTPPSSKESAVVMLADTVEAACRTLEKPSVSRLEKFIHQLVKAKYEHGQLDKAGLTFRDLTAIQSSFVTILAAYYHSRIEYPNQNDPDDVQDSEQNVQSGKENNNV